MPPTFRSPRRTGLILTKLLLGAGALATVGFGSVALLGQAGGKSAQPARGSVGTLEIHTAIRTSFDITTSSSGELEAKNQIELRNKLENGQATIVEIVDEGKFVKAGDQVLKLNDEDIKNKINEAESQLESAKAEEIAAKEDFEIQISQNDSALRAAQLKLDLARLELSQWLEGEVKQKRQENSLGLERSNRELDRLKEKYDQSIALEKQGFLSKDELKRDELAWLEAKAALDKAVLAEKVYEDFQHPKDQKTKQSAVDEAASELERVQKKNKSELASKEAALSNRKRQTSLRDEQLTKLRTQLAACTVTAPKDGLVVYGPTAEGGRGGGFFMRGDGPFGIGSQVYPNQLLIVLPDTSEMVATVKVHESLAGRVKEGLPCTVKVEAIGGRVFAGRVLNIGVLAEQSGRWMDPNLREYTVKIEIDGVEDAGLKPAMRCEAELNLGRVDDAIAVPLQAISNEGMLRYAYVPASSGGSKFVRRPILVGRRSDRFAEITAGLAENERVLLRQPTPGEVMDRPWEEKELAAVGLKQTPEGKIESISGRPSGPPGRPAAGNAAGKRPGRGNKPDAPSGPAVVAGGDGKSANPTPEAAKPEARPTADSAAPASTVTPTSAPAAAAPTKPAS